MCSEQNCRNISSNETIYPTLCILFQRQLAAIASHTNGTVNSTFDDMDPFLYDVKHFWFEIVIPIISSLGIIGNILNFVVLTRRRLLSSMDRLEKSATYGLVALALSDMLFCVVVLPHAFINEEYPVVDGDHKYIFYYKLHGIGLLNLFLMISTWLIVAMSISRYIVVVYPLHARSTLSTFHTLVIIFLVYIISIIMTLPHFLHLEVGPCLSFDFKLLYEFQPTFGPEMTTALLFYMRWIWPVIADFIPIAILFFCNSRLIWELKKATITRKRTAHGQMIRESGHRLTLTLVIIVLMLLFFVSPSEILKYINPYESWGYVGHVVAATTNVLQAINFAFNFILYCVVSATFRHTFKSIFSNCSKQKLEKTEMQRMLTQVNASTDKTVIIDTEILSQVNLSIDKTATVDTEIE